MEGAAHAETYRALGAGFLEQRHGAFHAREDRKSTRLNSSHSSISYAVFCLKKKKDQNDGDARSGSEILVLWGWVPGQTTWAVSVRGEWRGAELAQMGGMRVLVISAGLARFC